MKVKSVRHRVKGLELRVKGHEVRDQDLEFVGGGLGLPGEGFEG